VRHLKDFLNTVMSNPLVLSLNVLAVLSVLWSEAPGSSVSRNVALAMTTAFAIYFAARFSLSQQLRILLWTVVIVVVASVIIVLVAPQSGLAGPSWLGVFRQKNSFGHFMALGFLVVLTIPATSQRSRTYKTIALIILMILTFFSDSMSAILLNLIILCLFGVYRMLRGSVVALLATLAATLVPLLVVISLLSQVDTDAVLISLGRDPTLTGRTDVWANLEHAIDYRPWLGYGYGGFWNQWGGTYGTFWSPRDRWTPGSGHNSYIDVRVDLGIVGLILFIVIAVDAYLRAVYYARHTRTAEGLLPILYITFFLISGTSESHVLYNNTLWALFVAVCFSLSRSYVPESVTAGSREGASQNMLRAGLRRSLMLSKS
jgi:O-antigen ligase